MEKEMEDTFIMASSDEESEIEWNEWDFVLGRGNKHRDSKANSLVQDLAVRYSELRQTEKKLFAKIEVYDVVVKNGGRFLLYHNKGEYADVTDDQGETVRRIMQILRDKNKYQKEKQLEDDDDDDEEEDEASPNIIEPTSRRPKRRCVRPSIIEPPIIEKKMSTATAKRMKSHSNAVPNDLLLAPIASRRDNLQETEDSSLKNLPTTEQSDDDDGCDDNSDNADDDDDDEDDNKAVDEDSDDDDAFDNKVVVEPPRLGNTFSQLIMADEIQADLPTDSQHSINMNLHLRVQRLENLVAMLMQEKNGNLDLLLEDSTNSGH